MSEETARSRDDAVRIMDLGAPSLPDVQPPFDAPPRARRRRRVLAVVALLCLAGAAYSATAATGPRFDSRIGGALDASRDPSRGTSLDRPEAGAPLDVCSVHPGACAPSSLSSEASSEASSGASSDASSDVSPDASPDAPPVRDARIRFLPDGLTGTTGSLIRCEVETGVCTPVSEHPTACDVVASLKPGLGRLPQEVSSELVLPEGQGPLVVVGPGGVISPVGINFADGTVAVCGPLRISYTEDGAERVQAIAADDAVGGLDLGETYAYRFDGTGRLDLVGVRSPDGTVTPRS